MVVSYVLVGLLVLAASSAQDPGPLVLVEARERAARYLERIREPNGGWGSQTHRGAVAMAFLRPGYFSAPNCDAKILKQLVLANMYADLFASKGESSQTALYALALLATRQYTENLPGYNIQEDLEHKNNFFSVYANALNMVAVCLTNGTPNVTDLEQLVGEATKPLASDEWIDARSMSTIALACIARSHNDPRVQEAIRIAGHLLESRQTDDGSFGSLYSSSLAMQALVSLTGLVELNDWNYVSGMNYLLSQQKPSGAFDSLIGTFQVAPLLVGRTFLDVDKDFSDRPLEALSVPATISVRYILTRDDPTEVEKVLNQVQGQVPANLTFFEIMKLYGDPESHMFKEGFKFNYTMYEHMGAFITSIGGVANNATHYWMLYQRHVGQEDFSMSTVDVSNLYPKDKDDVAFVYKRVFNHT